MAPPSNANETTKVLSYVLVALLAFSGGYLVRYLTVDVSSQADGAGAAVADSDGADSADAPSGDAKIPIGDSPVLGPDDAPVTIVEYSDFECPFCQKGMKRLKKVRENYPEKVRIVFKHNPLPFHKKAKPAARASMAAEEQGKFWEMHDRLFENQKQWKNSNVKEVTAGWAKEMGLDVAKFKKDFDKDAYAERIKSEMQKGKELGVEGTPHFFINGERLSGAQPYNKFESIVESKLDQAEKMLKGGVAKSDLYAKAVAKNFDAPSDGGSDKGKKKKGGKKKKQSVEFVPIDDQDPVRGASADKALVTLVEFSDFECPFCDKVVPSLDKLKKNYGDKVRFVFKDRPLSMHKNAKPAARAGIAAQKQGKFWEMHDLMFKNQKKLKQGEEALVGFAKQLGLNVSKFKKDMNSSEAKKLLQDDIKLAGKVGARGTPTIFVNGIKVTGAQPYNKFKSIVESQIDKAQSIKDEKGLSGDKLYKAVAKANKDDAGGSGGGADKPSPKKKKKKKDPTVDTSQLSVGNSPVRGAENPKLTIYEFSDFECPYCKKAHPSVKKVLENYGDKVQLVHKQYPLPFHDQAKPAAKAAMAAQKQDKYWEMYDLMFKNQGKLGQDGVYEKWAKQIGLNVSKFKKDMESAELDSRIKQEMSMGRKVGVKGTPAFIIGDKRLVGAQPYRKFKSTIESQLDG